MARAIDQRVDALEARIEGLEARTARGRGRWAALLVAPALACSAPQSGAIRDVQARAIVTEQSVDVAIGARICADDVCIDVRTYYLDADGRRVVCVELPALMARPRCEVIP
jgi:hypothetical protein